MLLEIPDAVWSHISLDFIDGLPKAAGFDVILVVVDRLSKYVHYLALRHPYTVESVVEVFVKDIDYTGTLDPQYQIETRYFLAIFGVRCSAC